jgi:hypothetical protein
LPGGRRKCSRVVVLRVPPYLKGRGAFIDREEVG